MVVDTQDNLGVSLVLGELKMSGSETCVCIPP